MSWTILVNREAGHNKFWSYNQNGEVHWGRIGTRGQSGDYDMDTVMSRAREKLRSGYVLYAESASTPYPNSSGGSQPERENIAEAGLLREESTPRRTPRAYTRRRTFPTNEEIYNENNQPEGSGRVSQSNAIKVPKFDRHHSIPDVESYKTDSQGYIKYRQGYKRQVYDEYASSLKIVPVSQLIAKSEDGRFVGVDNIYFRKAKEYFNRIPSSSVYNKPDTFEQLRDPSMPTFAVLFSDMGRNSVEAVAIYGVHRANKISEFISLKSSTPYRKTILKHILKSISNYVSGTITFKIKSAALRNEIKEIAEYSIESSGNTLKYNVSDLQTGIPTTGAKPKRWID